MNDHTLNLENVLSILRRHALLIVACSIATAAAAYGFSRSQTKEYTAEAKLLFRIAELEEASGVAAAPSRDPQRDSDTNVRLVMLRGVAERAAAALGGGITADRLQKTVEVTAAGTTDIALVAATSADPRRAAAIANTVSETFIDQRREANSARILKARRLLQRRILELPLAQRKSLEAQSLRDRDESLAILASLQTGNVELAERATVPDEPSAPQVSRNTVIGGVLGLLLGIGLAFIRNRLDRRIKEPRDLEAVFGLPLLGVVPESSAYRIVPNGSGPRPLPAQESEAFRTLRAHLRYYNVDRDVRTVLVMSASPGEGKSTVARYLAEAAASMGTRTLLIEADLRRPSLGQRLGITATAGLGDVLIRACDAESAIRSVDTGGGQDAASSKAQLDVLLAGALPPNPAELIESQAMGDLLTWASARYGLVVIDTPPLAVVSDAISLLRKVDGVIIVSRLGESTNTSAERLRERLTTLGAPTLGVVANAYEDETLGGYGYMYGYDTAPDAKRGRGVKDAGAR